MKLYKRWLCLIVSFILVFTSATTSYAAGSDTSGGTTEDSLSESSLYVYDEADDGGILANGGLLEESSAQVYAGSYDHAHDAEIVAAIENVQASINVSGWGLTIDNYSTVMSNIWNTNPQFFYLDSYGCLYNSVTGDISTLQFFYKYDAQTISSMKQEVDSAVTKIEAEVDTTGMTDLEIALAYHDYLATYVAYDYANLQANTLPDTVFNIYGVFVKKSAVCQGYAEALQYLLTRKGITCGLATSAAANHAWNVILYNGKWYHIDATWDDPVWDNLGRVNHKYFMITDATLIADASAKSDYVTAVPYGSTYVAATDATYESGFWNNIGTFMYPYKNCWYYLEPVATGTISTGYTSYKKYQLVKYNYATAQKSVLIEPTEATWSAGGGSYWIDQFGRMAAKAGVIYYSTPKTVERYSIVTGNTSTIYTMTDPETELTSIYGLGFVNDTLYYVRKDAPNVNGAETYLELTICTNHTWGTPDIVPATYTTEGTSTCVCTTCGAVSVTPIPKLVYVASITLNRSELALYQSETYTLSATCLPSNAANKNVTWNSLNPDIASVDATGKVTARKVGYAQITATADDGSRVYASCYVSVCVPVSKIEVSASEIEMLVGESTEIIVTPTYTAEIPADSDYGVEMAWEYPDNNILTVGFLDTYGQHAKITGVTPGQATVRAVAQDGTGKYQDVVVTVYGIPEAPETPEITAKTCTSVTLKAVSCCEYSKDGVNWQTSNVFTGLSMGDTYTFYMRKQEDLLHYYKAGRISKLEQVTLAHNYSEQVIQPTYDNQGYTLHTCVTCGTSYKDRYTDKLVRPTTEESTTEQAVIETPAVTVRYTTHVQTFGWQGDENNASTWFTNGTMAGTSGKAKRLEGIKICVDGNSRLDIQYTTHCQSYGWLPWSANGEMNGTQGEAKRLEAIKIQLTGPDKDKYDVYYRVHAQSYGWLGWAKNGSPAGTAGYSKRLEGIQIVVVKKGVEAPGLNYAGVNASGAAYAGQTYIYRKDSSPVVPGENNTNVTYRTHVQTYGWQGWKYNGQMSGTSGQAKRLEGINIRLTNQQYSGDIVYTTHVQTYGWQGDLNNQSTWKKNGQMSGTSGQAKRLEAIKINLTGEMAAHYDIYYRVHAQTYGWLGWAKNGEASGTAGYAKRLEGIQIVLVPKGGAAPANNYGGVVSTQGRAYISK